MSIAALYNIPASPEQLAQWSFVNATQHADIVRLIFQATGRQLDSYVLDPFDPQDPSGIETWVYQHQTMHQQMDAVLGILGYDLTDVDFTNQGVLAGWIQSHAAEHVQAGHILNLAVTEGATAPTAIAIVEYSFLEKDPSARPLLVVSA